MNQTVRNLAVAVLAIAIVLVSGKATLGKYRLNGESTRYLYKETRAVCPRAPLSAAYQPVTIFELAAAVEPPAYPLAAVTPPALGEEFDATRQQSRSPPRDHLGAVLG